MPKKTYIAQAGDTLQNVSRQFYGIPNRTEEIINANQFLNFRRDSGNVTLDGVPNVFAGDVITVLTDAPVTLSDAEFRQPDEITLLLNGNETPTPEGSELTLNYDTCCNSFSSRFPWDPFSDYDRALWVPESPPELDIFCGSQQLFGGKFEQVYPEPSIDQNRVAVAARTHTLLIEKSVAPLAAYPLEREKENLQQIAEWLCRFFGIGIDTIDAAEQIFKKASMEGSSTKCWEFLSRLATTRERVMHASDDGRSLRIVSPSSSEAVARFEQGVDGFEPPRFRFNTANLFGNQIASVETPRRPDRKVTYKDEQFEEESYGFFEIKDSTVGDSQNAIQYQALKNYRDFFTTPIFPGTGILNPQGKPWKPGQIVTIKSPSAMIYEDFDFLVRSVRLPLGVDEIKPIITIIPPQCYAGQPISPFPWANRFA
jgi:hypothetical protein